MAGHNAGTPKKINFKLRGQKKAMWGRGWISQPTLLPPLLISWALLVAPFFIMMPGMGSGIAGSKTPKPNVTRFKSFVGHSVFGLGMYATAMSLAHAWPPQGL